MSLGDMVSANNAGKDPSRSSRDHVADTASVNKKRKRSELEEKHKPGKRQTAHSATAHADQRSNGNHVSSKSTKTKKDKKHTAILDKFERSVKRAAERPEDPDKPAQEENLSPSGPLRDLVPIPRPAAQPRAKPTFSALPSWLSEPTLVSHSDTKPFKDLGVADDLLKQLKAKGLQQALAVQTAVIPLLHPHTPPNSICVSAATGSGKTLAYVLPVVQALKRRVFEQLRAVFIVPTRELVSQVREVLEICTSGTDLKVGTAVGSHNLKPEQDALIQRGIRYDPNGWAQLQKVLEDPVALKAFEFDPSSRPDIAEAVEVLPDHVPEWTSKVDILVCTPGRLVEHLKKTRGFTLKHLDYLVIDEADRLLDQSFQDWADLVNREITAAETPELPKYVKEHPALSMLYSLKVPKKVRKVMLSATMTKDLDQLAVLKLSSPKLIVVGDAEEDVGDSSAPSRLSGFSLPPGLTEHGVPVDDSAFKPLYAISLLDHIFDLHSISLRPKASKARPKKEAPAESSGSDSSSSEESSSEESSVVSSDSSSDSDSDSDSDLEEETSSQSATSEDSSDDDSESSVSDGSKRPVKPEASNSVNRTSMDLDAEESKLDGKHTKGDRKCLVFTGSSESALRLAEIIPRFNSAYAGRIGTIARGSTQSQIRKIFSKFRAGQLSILIASDKASRGLDLPDLSDVVNYDVPSKVETYIHRVGRTARAGRDGTAWTLLEHSQAKWFWKQIGRAESGIDRGSKTVARTRLTVSSVWSDQTMRKYQKVLRDVKGEVHAQRS